MCPNLLKLVSDGLFAEALTWFCRNHSIRFVPDRFTFSPLFKACAKLELARQGRSLHALMLKKGFSSDVYAATAATDMYMKLRLVDGAQKVFEEMPQKDLASFNALITGLLRNGYLFEGIRMFKHMNHGSFRPNSKTIGGVLSALDGLQDAMTLHCLAVKLGTEANVFVATSLLTVYASNGKLALAENVFHGIPFKNVVSCNAFMSGLLYNGEPLRVLFVFKDTRQHFVQGLNHVTFILALSSCSILAHIIFGMLIHGLVLKGETGFEAIVGNALADMYSKCGLSELALDLFNELNGKRSLVTWNLLIAGMMLNGKSENAADLFNKLESEGLKPDAATWNSMISGYSHLGMSFEAFKYFKKMNLAGFLPNLKIMTSILHACTGSMNVRCGKAIHAQAIRTDNDRDVIFATAVIDMYMKSGQLYLAELVFDQCQNKPRDPAFWNAMIYGYGINEAEERAFEIFDEMIKRNVKPNENTLLAVISVCNHSGNVDKGIKIFRMMKEKYGFYPELKHYNCVIDMLGRHGQLDEARVLMQELPKQCSSIASLLGACENHLNTYLGEEMALELSRLEPQSPTTFVIKSNIHAALGKWDDVEEIRRSMKQKGITKVPGVSHIEAT